MPHIGAYMALGDVHANLHTHISADRGKKKNQKSKFRALGGEKEDFHFIRNVLGFL